LNTLQNNGFKFMEFIKVAETEMFNFQPIAGSFAVIKCNDEYLMCYNIWRNQWELPAGSREGEETPKECAIRELFEETGQAVPDLEFKGLLKSEKKANGEVKYNPVYFATIEKLQPFRENEEISEIKLWDLKEVIGCIDSVDVKILEYI